MNGSTAWVLNHYLYHHQISVAFNSPLCQPYKGGSTGMRVKHALYSPKKDWRHDSGQDIHS